jgi:hypothetical protein
VGISPLWIAVNVIVAAPAKRLPLVFVIEPLLPPACNMVNVGGFGILAQSADIVLKKVLAPQQAIFVQLLLSLLGYGL